MKHIPLPSHISTLLHGGKTAAALAAVLILISLTLFSCKSKSEKDEEKGMECLKEARAFLASRQYGKARQAIKDLRKLYPLAFEAREEAILTLDSVEIAAASDVSDSASKDAKQDAALRLKFFTRKLSYDRKNYRKR